MWFVGRLVEVASGRTRSAVGTIDAAGQVVLKPVRTSFGAEPVAGPQGTRWTVVEGGLGRIEDDLTVTTVPVGGAIPGPLPGLVLGSDGLLWVHVVRPDGPVIARVRADGSIASTVPLPEHGPVPPSFGVVGPDGAAYFGVARGFLRVSTDGQVRLVLKTGKTRPTDGPGESVVFAGRIHHLVRFGCCYGGYDYGDWREPGRLDLDGRAFPVVTGRALGPVVPEGSVTIEVQVAGDRGTPGGTVTVVDHTYFTHHGFGGDSYAPVATADLDAGGRARVTVPVSRFSVGFHVDYPGSSTYHGTTSLDVRYQRDTRSETERYVSHVYRDLLRREPEPAGMQYWTATLNRGTPRTAVAHALAISTEHRERFVDGLFRRYLGRDADRAGRDSFVADLARGATMNQIRASILGSQEYFVRRGGGTVDGFISALYQQVLDRQPDAQGRAFWRTELARGVSKPTVASALLASQEAQRRLVDGHFQDLLRRGVDSGGRDHWVSLLQRGFREERLIADLIGSQEYYGRAVAGTYG